MCIMLEPFRSLAITTTENIAVILLDASVKYPLSALIITDPTRRGGSAMLVYMSRCCGASQSQRSMPVEAGPHEIVMVNAKEEEVKRAVEGFDDV
ncbi:hypothetical protein RJT34_12049 [Clitoria ternatea]|uniref:Uncharacterized protein n=1 Tax=Clitoria ternatea TaxID=43366 RepID=A0AAN9PKA8_CLITE